jgi:amino acid transporter
VAEISGETAAARTTTPKLFVRQSSGLVRNVSVTNALFFNVAAFVGVGLTLYPIFYSLPAVHAWKLGPFSAYGWAAIIAGLFCVLLAIIFSSLTSVMPRSGGDYVFSSRIMHSSLGWMESFTLVIASILIIAFEVPLVCATSRSRRGSSASAPAATGSAAPTRGSPTPPGRSRVAPDSPPRSWCCS